MYTLQVRAVDPAGNKDIDFIEGKRDLALYPSPKDYMVVLIPTRILTQIIFLSPECHLSM